MRSSHASQGVDAIQRPDRSPPTLRIIRERRREDLQRDIPTELRVLGAVDLL
jgi:hypothetical protein